MRKKKIFVTGADGFIGSHLTEKLLDEGHEVTAFAMYNSFGQHGWLDECDPGLCNGLEVISGDIRDYHRVKSAMKGADLVLHLAALIAIPYSYHAPQSYVDTNVTGTLNIVQAARELEIARVVHTSTSEVYGTAQFVPITEEHPLQGQSPYSASKIAADQIALSYYHAFNTPVAVIRPFNTYGPRQSTRAVIPTVITQCLAGQREIALGALHPTRDFSFVEDTVRGFLAVAQSDAAVGEVTNIGSGFEVSIEETAKLIAEALGVEIDIVTDQNRLRPEKSEVERLFASYEKAKQTTGWEPLYGGREGFKKGVAITAEWFKKSQSFIQYQAERYHV